MVLKLEDYRKYARGCVRCSNCKFIEHIWMQSARFARQCPMNVRYAFNAYSAPGLMHMASALLEGQLDYTPKFLDALYKCNLCGTILKFLENRNGSYPASIISFSNELVSNECKCECVGVGLLQWIHIW